MDTIVIGRISYSVISRYRNRLKKSVKRSREDTKFDFKILKFRKNS